MSLTPPPKLTGITGMLSELLSPKLVVPVAYVVSFSLSGPVGVYDDFFQELKQTDNWMNYIPGFWIVMSRLTLVDLAARLRSKIRTGDWLIVMPAKGPADGWLPYVAWEWIEKNLRKEW